MLKPLKYGKTRIGRQKTISIAELVRIWAERTEIEKDNHVAISGDEGDGKSHLLCHFINRYPGANFWDNIVYTSNMKEFMDKYETLQEQSILGLDEALDSLDRLDWAKIQSRTMVKFIRGKIRKEKRATVLYAVQLFRSLSGYFRQHRIRYWLELSPREYFQGKNGCFVLERARVPFLTGTKDPWLMPEIEKSWIQNLGYGGVSGPEYINMLRLNPFYKGEFLFNPLSENDHKLYLKRRLEAIEIYKPGVEEEIKTNKRELLYQKKLFLVYSHLKNELGYSNRKIGEITGIKASAISQFIVRQRELHGIKEQETSTVEESNKPILMNLENKTY